MANAAEADSDPMWASREATKINVALAKLGWNETQKTQWWNGCRAEELEGRTPTQAWQGKQYAEVKALVEKLLSDALASEIGSNPTISQRLADNTSR